MGFESLIRRFARKRILVVGDLMLDQFIWGRVDRVSPEAPVPVVNVSHETFHLGGAGNVAHNLRCLGAQVAVCGVVGNDSTGKRLVQQLREIGVDNSGVIAARGTLTIRKTRVIAHSQQVVRFDREQRQHSARTIERLAAFLGAKQSRFDAVLISDYAKGVINPTTLATLTGKSRAPILVVDPKKANFAAYSNVTLVTPNVHEAADAAGFEIVDDATLRQAGKALLDRWQAKAILITRGEQGMTLIEEPKRMRHFPTMSQQVFDVTGAGDTVVALCTLALAAGASFEDAAHLANHAAGVVVGKLGTATLTPAELRASLRSG